MKKILIFSCILLFFSCKNEISEKEGIIDAGTNHRSESKETEYTVLAIHDSEMGWGYQLLKDGKLMIEQKHIPAIQGYKGFSTKEDAEKTGSFIIDKIKKGAFPPTVSVEELDSLGVLK